MSALFQPFRALGYITEKVPFAVQRRGKETFVTVGVGKAWQVLLQSSYSKLTRSASRLFWPWRHKHCSACARTGRWQFSQ